MNPTQPAAMQKKLTNVLIFSYFAISVTHFRSYYEHRAGEFMVCFSFRMSFPETSRHRKCNLYLVSANTKPYTGWAPAAHAPVVYAQKAQGLWPSMFLKQSASCLELTLWGLRLLIKELTSSTGTWDSADSIHNREGIFNHFLRL